MPIPSKFFNFEVPEQLQDCLHMSRNALDCIAFIPLVQKRLGGERVVLNHSAKAGLELTEIQDPIIYATLEEIQDE